MKDFNIEDLNVVYEDNHIIVVVKPQGIPTQADISGDLDMLSIVKEYIKVKYNKPGNVYVGLVHRLDRPTGGVMVFAKTSKAAKRLNEKKEIGEFEKTYFCVVSGVPKNKNGHLTNYLKKNELLNLVQVVPMFTEGAKEAKLEYTKLNTIQGYSLMKVNLITGRSHQIRVQMAHIGTPIFGDKKYSQDNKTFKYPLALWATEIRITHPTTNEKMTFRVFPPKDNMPWKPFNVGMYLTVSNFGNPYSMFNLDNNK